MNIFVRHSIDVYNCRYIAGWFLNFFNCDKPIKLRFVSGEQEVGEVVANRYRKDVQLRKVHPTGFCGFDFSYPSNIDISAQDSLDIYLNAQKKPYLKLPSNHFQTNEPESLPPILFMHIPKTAGTSFNSFMRLYIPQQFATHHLEYVDKSSYAILAEKKRYLAGHLPIDRLKKHFNMSDFDCYTIIRKPYQHLHSHLNWLKGIAAFKGTAFFKRHNQEVRNLAMKIGELDFTDLYQIKKFVMGLQSFELDFFDNCQTRYFLDYRPEKVSLGDFQNAQSNLKLFKRIGLTEKYEQFTSFITATYDLPEASPPAVVNKAMHPRLYDCHSEDMKELFYPLVHADTLLYNSVYLARSQC